MHGHNVDDWPLAALRTRISYLDQSFLLVEGTVRDNLALGHEPAPSEEKMWDALTQVGLTERVESLADGPQPFPGSGDPAGPPPGRPGVAASRAAASSMPSGNPSTTAHTATAAANPAPFPGEICPKASHTAAHQRRHRTQQQQSHRTQQQQSRRTPCSSRKPS